MKIRGNAHHIAEKYLQLARDAHTGGDPVAAENYLQHAEHYFRLIAAAQAAQLAAQGRPPGEVEVDDADDEDDGGVLDRFASPAERTPPYNPQPQAYAPQPNSAAPPYGYVDRQPYEGERPAQGERNAFQARGDRSQPGRHDNRPPRPAFTDRGENAQRDNRNGPDGRPQREFRNYREMNPQPTVDVPANALPSFITAAPRVPTPAEALDAPQPVVEAPEEKPGIVETAPPTADDAALEPRFPRGRRRRLRSPYGFQIGGEETTEAPPPPDTVPNSE